jgi:ABC-type transporter lipoprotein component MlaA
MCQRIGFPFNSTIGFGLFDVSSEILVPKPPARIITFIMSASLFDDFPL